jgi:hypothetical protein
MSNEPTWLRTYLEELSREAGQTGPTEAWKAQIEAMVFPIHSEVDPGNSGPASLRIDEMTLADYRRGVANMKTHYV